MCIGIFSFRAFDRRLARLAAPISSGVRQGGRICPPPAGRVRLNTPAGRGLWYSKAWSYATLRWAIFRPYYSILDAYFHSEFLTPHPDSKAILGHWKSLMCKSKVEGALPPHLKSWVGTCPHCPHGSYATDLFCHTLYGIHILVRSLVKQNM